MPIIRIPVYTVEKRTGLISIPNSVNTSDAQALHAACMEAMKEGNVQLFNDGVYIQDADDAVDFTHIEEGQYRIIKDVTAESIGKPFETRSTITCAVWKRDDCSASDGSLNTRQIYQAKSRRTYCAVNLMVDGEQVGAGVWCDGWAPTALARLKAASMPLPDAEMLLFGDYSPIRYAEYKYCPMQEVEVCECTDDCFAVSLIAPCTEDEPYELLTYFVNGAIHGIEVVQKSYMNELRGEESPVKRNALTGCRQLACTIAELFESGLHKNNITCYCKDENEQKDWENCEGYSPTGMYGSEYDELVSHIETILTRELFPTPTPALVHTMYDNTTIFIKATMREFFKAHAKQFKGDLTDHEIEHVIKNHIQSLHNSIYVTLATSDVFREEE